MEADFSRPRDERKATREIAAVVKNIPAAEAVLIFTYKSRGKIDYRRILLDDLAAAGVDIAGTVSVTEGGTVVQRPRLNILTWGNETSLNSFSFCRHVFTAGIVQRSLVDLAAAYLGQTDNLQGQYTNDQVAELLRSECAHVAYQAASRGSCRVMVNGQAMAMDFYPWHRDQSLRVKLEQVMPGAVWKTWGGKYGDPSQGSIAATTGKIVSYLSGLVPTVSKVSTRQVKVDLGLGQIPDRSFTVALRRVPALAPWAIQGRSLVRLFAEFPI
jgi:hypothetical protein